MSSSKTPSDDSHFSSLFGSEFDVTRARSLTSTNTIKQSADCVLLWMNRDQRVQDNWAMVAGCKLAKIKKVPLKVVFGCFPTFGSMSTRQYNFMFEGLKEVEKELIDLRIPFEVVCGDPGVEVLKYAKSSNPVAVLTDFFPLRNCNDWNTAVASGLDSVSVPLIQIDAHNVVPAWLASDKQEVGARTLRPKIHKVYQKYLTRFPPIEPNPDGTKMPTPTDWTSVMKSISSEVEVTTIPDTFKPGKTAGMSVFSSFCESRLKNYADNRNDPNLHVQSDMSPYIRFGQVSFQRLALSIRDLKRHSSGTAAYIEEGVVRRELADNYCLYNDNYDNLNGAAGWARESLMLHR
jgi:deoxyribodipyrimidine photo-lyase